LPLSSSDVAALRAVEQALVESFEASDRTAWVDFYTDDAIFVAPRCRHCGDRRTCGASRPRSADDAPLVGTYRHSDD